MNTKTLTKINKKEKSKCVFCARLLEGAKYVSLGPTEQMGTVRFWPNQLYRKVDSLDTIFWRNMGIVMVLLPFYDIDFLEFTGPNQL